MCNIVHIILGVSVKKILVNLVILLGIIVLFNLYLFFTTEKGIMPFEAIIKMFIFGSIFMYGAHLVETYKNKYLKANTSTNVNYTLEPTLEEYGLSSEKLKAYDIQTLNIYAFESSYEESISKWLLIIGFIISFAIFSILQVADSFIGLLFYSGTSAFILITVISISFIVINYLLSAIHPKTKSIKKYNEHLSKYKEYLNEQKKIEEKKLLEEYMKKREFYYSLTGHQFEYIVADIFKKNGYTGHVTSGSDDKGVDINLWKDNKYIVVQCKAFKNKAISPGIVRELYGTMVAHNADEAYIVTLEGLSKKSEEFIADKPIKSFDVKDLILLQE